MSIEERATKRITLGLQAHATMVVLHGLLLFEVGAAIVLFGGTTALTSAVGPSGHILVGVAAMLAGLATMVGLPRAELCRASHWVLVAGLAGIIAWEVFMAYTFGKSALAEGFPSFVGTESDGTSLAARMYVPLLYLNVAFLALVHLVTLVRIGQPER